MATRCGAARTLEIQQHAAYGKQHRTTAGTNGRDQRHRPTAEADQRSLRGRQERLTTHMLVKMASAPRQKTRPGGSRTCHVVVYLQQQVER